MVWSGMRQKQICSIGGKKEILAIRSRLSNTVDDGSSCISHGLFDMCVVGKHVGG